MTVAVSGDNITFPDNSVQTTAPKVGMVNRVINGGMTIDQRNAGATTTPADFAFITDRWQIRQSTASKFSAGQSSTVPDGFSKSLLITSLSSYAVSSSDVYVVRQQIEGFNTADLGWGTANAQAVTLSFKVRSSLTGTFGGSFLNAANNRSYVFTYTINAANTFEDKAVTIAGDTTGTWEIGNLRGIQISFGLGVGSTASGTAGSWVAAALASATGATSVVGTSGATFYITGVQLEKGSTATSFDYRPYGTELALCQRYAYYPDLGGSNYPSTQLRPDGTRLFMIPYKQTMRAAPTATYTYDSDGSGATLGTPTSTKDYFRVQTSASLTGGSDPRFNAFNVTAEL